MGNQKIPGLTGGGDAVNAAGDQSVNEGPDAADRSPALQSSKTDGPQIGTNGEYQPAVYDVTQLVSQGNDRPPLAIVLTREDR